MAALLDHLVLDRSLHAERRLEQRYLDVHSHVTALHGRRAPTATEPERIGAAEERVEDVGERAEALKVRRVSARVEPFPAVAVVDGALFVVDQDLLRLGQLLELLLGFRVVVIDVGMELARLQPEGLLDLPLGGIAADAEDLVGVAFHS